MKVSKAIKILKRAVRPRTYSRLKWVTLDARARIEVSISEGEIEGNKRIQELVKSDRPLKEKISEAKEIIKEIAEDKIADINKMLRIERTPIEIITGPIEIDLNAEVDLADIIEELIIKE